MSPQYIFFKTFLRTKELSLCHELRFYSPYIFGTQCRKPLILQTYIIWFNRSRSLKFQKSTTLESEDIGIRISEFVSNTQFLHDKQEVILGKCVGEVQNFVILEHLKLFCIKRISNNTKNLEFFNYTTPPLLKPLVVPVLSSIC